MGEKSMLKPFWTVEQRESTATPPLSKPMDFPCYHYRTPYFHETLMGQSTHRELLAMLQPYKWKWVPDTQNEPISLLPILETMMYS